ncbi:MAG TPA: DNA methyltransferase [Pirellulales bacterium]|nr:DNA methyltransferase [Pirellulales bacterium]
MICSSLSLTLDEIPLDLVSIPRESLDLDGKERSNLLPWNGQFSPQLVEVLLRTFSSPGNRVCDPFLGSGTVLCESARRGFSACGAEINPAAFQMASTYRLINMPPMDRTRMIQQVQSGLFEAIPEHRPLFGAGPPADPIELQRVLSEAYHSHSNEHGRHLFGALIVLLDFFKPGLTPSRVYSTWDKLKELVTALPHSKEAIELAQADARAMPFTNASVDLVLTSPPYINVFNYHQHYRRSMESIGWDLLRVARSEIGSNRKHRGNRFLTVIQYCLDMADALAEMKRVLRPNGRCILVMGRESNVRKTAFSNGAIIAALAAFSVGLTPAVRQERAFKNKFGNVIYEDILHFINDGAGTNQVPPGDIARRALEDAVDRAPADSQADLREALAGHEAVEPSPLFDIESAEPRKHWTIGTRSV